MTRAMSPPAVNGEHQTVQQAPQNKVKSSTVPQPTDSHRNQEVQINTWHGDARSSQRDVDIVEQPGGKRDMPVAPEIGDVGLKVGPIEIFWNANAKEPCGADGDIRVGGKVGIDLQAVSEKPQGKDGAMCDGDVRHVEMVGVCSEQIRNGELFGQTSENPGDAALPVE